MVLQIPANRFHLKELTSADPMKTLVNDVRAGLLASPRSLPPKYFYNDEGSKLFNEICETKDYYPTRTEFALFNEHADEIINTVQARTYVELGAGASTKTEVLLSKLNINLDTYITIDVCQEILVDTANRLLNTHPNLQIKSLIGEYLPALQALPVLEHPALYIFIGSSIGNFTEQESIELLSEVSRKMNSSDYFLLGLDRVKDKSILERAYDDEEGVTAKFNLNVLQVLNDKLGSNFNLNNFLHQAIYNEQNEQIEMYLKSKKSQTIDLSLLNETIRLQKDERILTEISRKYTKTSIQRMLLNSGLKEVLHFEPINQYFSLILAKRV